MTNTRYVCRSRGYRLAVVIWAIFFLVILLKLTPHVATWEVGIQGTPDLELYRDLVSRVHDGSGYYDAADQALHANGFETNSPFNWRLPAYAVLLGQLETVELARWLLLALALASVILVVRTIVAPVAGSFGQLLALLLLLGGTFGWVVYEPDAFFATEPWCEVLLLLSICAYASGRWQWGMAAAVAGLALRELMLPYCVVAFLIALKHRRRNEAIAWLVVFTLFAIGIYLHTQAVYRRVPQLNGLGTRQWLVGFDLRYSLLSSSMNLVVRPLPPTGWAIVLALGLIGLGGWRGDIGHRMFATAAVYVAAFCVVEARTYWGQFFAPLLMIGLINAPASLRDLVWPTRSPSGTIASTPNRNPDHAGDGPPAQ